MLSDLPKLACVILLIASGHSPKAAQANEPISLEARQLTVGPKHHFFGYIGHVQNIPWNQSGRYLLALRTSFQNHLPRADEPAEIVLLDTKNNYSERVLTETRAWNPQQGTMLYWNPDAPETQFFFNDREPETGNIFCALFDISMGNGGKRIREYRFDDTPVGNAGVAQKGGWFTAINYARLARLRPVTGYPDAFDWTVGVRHPTNDGVFKVDVRTGEKQLLVSFQQLAEALRPSRPDVTNVALFINHTLNNRDSDRIFFFARGNFNERANRINQGFIVRPDGSGFTPLKQFIGGHPEWASGPCMIGDVDGRQIVYDVDEQKLVETLGNKEIFPNPGGDVALSPDGKWLVNGHRHGTTNFYTFFRIADGAWVRSQGFDVRGWESGDLRCDPAPCWNRNNREIVFPAIAKDGTRQMFLLQVKTGTPQ
ncbi:MAG TPA: hypothetical protein VFZ59_27435 [Verrucomicrobiae bacterium]|nr:hypothetical protein [Verrucomicrobiae bacterium]